MKCDYCGGTQFKRLETDDMGFEHFACAECGREKIFQVVTRRKKKGS